MANPASKAQQDLSGTPGSPSVSNTQQAADLAALTVRDDFLLELGEVLGGRASVHPADSIDGALAHLEQARHTRVLVIDARETGDVRANVERAAAKIPNTVVLVFAEEEAEKEIAAALKGTKVFAVLPVPVEAAKTTAVLDAALSGAEPAAPRHRHSAAAAASEATPPSMRSSLLSRPAAAQEPAEPSGRGRILWPVVGVAILAAGGATAYFVHHRGPAPASVAVVHAAGHTTLVAAPPIAQPVVDTSIVQGRVDDLLDLGRRAMFARHFTTPKGANALVYYRSVLAVDPSNGEALDGLRRVGNVLVSRFDDAIGHSQYPAAALALATLKVARPADPHIAAFERQLYTGEISQALAGGHGAQAAALLAAANRDGVPSAALGSLEARVGQLQRSQQADSLAAAVSSSIRADNLTGPGGAQADLAQLRALAPTAAATQRAAQALTAAMLAKAAQDALAGNSADENHWLAKARANGASAADMTAFERQLASQKEGVARAKIDSLLSLARTRIQSGALTAPATDSAAYYLQTVEADHPTGATLASERRVKDELASKLIARAETQARAGHGSAAQADIALAHQWGATTSQMSAAASAIHADLAQAEQPTAAEIARLAAQLVRVRYTAPTYPDRALLNRVAGQVTVQYVVDQKGIPQDLRVVESNPRGVFDKTTLNAIRRWRYRPVKFRGKPVSVPVSTLIRFELPNN